MTQKQLSIPTQEPTIQIINNQLMVSSLDVAEKFNKRHDNVVRAIKSLDIPEDFTALNFEASTYVDSTGKENLCYNITRDGFVILVMGFTGKEAMQWKIRYIQAFNAMEAQLLQKPQQLQLDAPSTKEDREPLTNLVNTLVKHAPVDYPDVWHMIKAKLKTDKAANDFTVGEVHKAIAFVQERVDLHTAKPAYADYPDAHLGLITEMALQGARKFSIYISLGDKKTRNTTLITKVVRADIYLIEENAVEPKGLSYSIKFVK